MNRSDVKSKLLEAYGSYKHISEHMPFTGGYVFHVLNNEQRGSIIFFDKCLSLIEESLSPEDKALQIIALLQEYRTKKEHEEEQINEMEVTFDEFN